MPKKASAKAYLMWSDMQFCVDKKTFRILDGFSRTYEYKVEEDEDGCDAKKIPTLKKQHPNAQEVTFSVPLNWAYAKVQDQINKWEKKLGKESYMFQNGALVGINKLMLININETDVEWGGNGDKIKATLNLTFKENRSKSRDNKKAAKKVKKNKNKWKKK